MSIRISRRALTAGLGVDHVVTGCRHRNHLQRRQARQQVSAQGHLVGDGHRGTGQALHHFLGRGLLVLGVGLGAGRPAHVGLERGAVEEDDLVRGGAGGCHRGCLLGWGSWSGGTGRGPLTPCMLRSLGTGCPKRT